MELSTVVNTSFLCVFNVIFMITGIFLNYVVIISPWKSSQLRKKLCYFTILVLSCFDLAAVAIMHPIQISTTISIAFGKYNNMQEVIRFYLANAINGLSMFALLVLNIERFLALSYPFFHQTSVTKERLILLLVALMILPTVIVLSLTYLSFRLLANLVSTIGLSVFLLLFIYLNYKMFKIARSKRDNETGANLSNQERKRFTLQFKMFSTCALAVTCYFVCSGPYLVYSALRLTSNRNTPFQDLVFYHLWTSTFVCMNSTFNCLILFWKNSILRREGINIVKRFWTGRFCRGCFSNEVIPKER